MEKFTITTKNKGELYNNPVEVIADKQAKELSHKISMFIKAQIREKPPWFPSQNLWERIAVKFLQIDTQHPLQSSLKDK